MKARRLIRHGIRQIEVEDFEIGALPDDGLLVENEYTAISVGTELWNWTHGAEPSGTAKFPQTTGYCNAGRVLEVGKNVTGISPGDRVAGQSNHASHAIMRGLQHKVPEGTSSKAASLLTMSAIAMHGIRVAKIELGEAVVVLGLGLVGQFALSLARLAGGMPVIATRVGVMPDVIKDEVNGLLITGDAQDLMEKIQRLLGDAELQKQLGTEARKILDRFERLTLIKQYADFLKALV